MTGMLGVSTRSKSATWRNALKPLLRLAIAAYVWKERLQGPSSMTHAGLGIKQPVAATRTVTLVLCGAEVLQEARRRCRPPGTQREHLMCVPRPCVARLGSMETVVRQLVHLTTVAAAAAA